LIIISHSPAHSFTSALTQNAAYQVNIGHMDDDFNIFYRFNSDICCLEILPVDIFNRQDGAFIRDRSHYTISS
jgi:hypothetical protein